ncbi:hypothetical protein QJS66_09750 [Kocuria rhizophila]|nr:hypothetical protein QJS66_09750 [Kocuria rhizophila]
MSIPLEVLRRKEIRICVAEGRQAPRAARRPAGGFRLPPGHGRADGLAPSSAEHTAPRRRRRPRPGRPRSRFAPRPREDVLRDLVASAIVREPR